MRIFCKYHFVCPKNESDATLTFLVGAGHVHQVILVDEIIATLVGELEFAVAEQRAAAVLHRDERKVELVL